MEARIEAIRPQPVLVAQVVRPAAGGIRRHVETLLTGLDRDSFDSTLYAPSDFRVQVEGLKQFPLEISSRTNPGSDIRAILRLSQLLRLQNDSIQLVHAHGLRGALIGVLAAKRVSIPSVFTSHNLVGRLTGLNRWMLNQVACTATRIIAVSKAVADTLKSNGVDRAKIEVIPNGIELSGLQHERPQINLLGEYGIPDDARLVVAVGRLAREKGFDVLITAFQQVTERLTDAHLILVGAGPEEAALRKLASPVSGQNNPISPHPRICFAGHVPDIVPLLRAAEIVVIPSRQEGQGIVALEAMACGIPVIASRIGGLAETITDGVSGLLTPPQEPDALTQAIVKLLSDSDLRSRLGAAGKSSVETNYTSQEMVTKIQSVYRSLVKI